MQLMHAEMNATMRASLSGFGLDPERSPELAPDLAAALERLSAASDPLSALEQLLPDADEEEPECRYLALDERFSDRTTDGRVLRDGLALLHTLHELFSEPIERGDLLLSLSYWCDVGLDDDDLAEPYDHAALYAYLGPAVERHVGEDLSHYLLEGVLRLVRP
jgi:hypothetical protein